MGESIVLVSLSTSLRDAIKGSGRSLNALARSAEMDPSQLARFVSGDRTLTLDSADRLALSLNLVLVPKKGRKKLSTIEVQAGANPLSHFVKAFSRLRPAMQLQ